MHSTKAIVITLLTAFTLLLAGFSVPAILMALTMAVAIGRSETWPIIHAQQVKPQQPIAMQEQGIRVHRLSCDEDAVMRFMAGQRKCIELGNGPSPDFPQDIPVYGAWIDREGQTHRAHIGFIPSQKLHRVYQTVALHPECRVEAHPSHNFILTREKRFPGLNIDVAVMEPVATSA